MTKTKRTLLLSATAAAILAISAGIYWKQLKKSPQAPTPSAIEAPATVVTEPTPTPTEPESEPLKADLETTPKMGVAQGRGEFLVDEYDSDAAYPVFTHALCIDGTIRSLQFVKAEKPRETRISYKVEGLPVVADMCVAFRGYDPATIRLVKDPDRNPNCKAGGSVRSCAEANWQICDEKRRAGTRWCQYVEVTPDLEARIFTTATGEVCEYRNIFIYKGREILLAKEEGVYGETTNSKFKKVVECKWADDQYGDSERFEDSEPDSTNNNILYLFTVGTQTYFLYHVYGMEGDNWDIHELKDDSVPVVAGHYYYNGG